MLGWAEANSTEWDQATAHPVVVFMPEGAPAPPAPACPPARPAACLGCAAGGRSVRTRACLLLPPLPPPPPLLLLHN